MLIDDLAYSNRLRRVHPREKAGFASLCLIASLVARTPLVPILVGTTVTLAALGLAHLPARSWLRLSLLPMGFLLAGGLSLALNFGRVCPPWSVQIARGVWLGSSPSSLRLALHITARSLGCTLAMLFLAATTPLVDLVQLLQQLRVPALAIELLTLTYRALFLLLETAGQLHQAQASRLGYSGFRASLRSLGLLATRLFGTSMRRGDLAWQAMLSRGYGDELRVLTRDYQVSTARCLVAAAVGFALLGLALIPVGGWL